jgi:hypothetical protein
MLRARRGVRLMGMIREARRAVEARGMIAGCDANVADSSDCGGGGVGDLVGGGFAIGSGERCGALDCGAGGGGVFTCVPAVGARGVCGSCAAGAACVVDAGLDAAEGGESVFALWV